MDNIGDSKMKKILFYDSNEGAGEMAYALIETYASDRVNILIANDTAGALSFLEDDEFDFFFFNGRPDREYHNYDQFIDMVNTLKGKERTVLMTGDPHVRTGDEIKKKVDFILKKPFTPQEFIQLILQG